MTQRTAVRREDVGADPWEVQERALAKLTVALLRCHPDH
jgi:hypothetical protein